MTTSFGSNMGPAQETFVSIYEKTKTTVEAYLSTTGQLLPSRFRARISKQTPWPSVRKRTIPTDRQPPVGEI
jgi:hypothetical protein